MIKGGEKEAEITGKQRPTNNALFILSGKVHFYDEMIFVQMVASQNSLNRKMDESLKDPSIHLMRTQSGIISTGLLL